LPAWTADDKRPPNRHNQSTPGNEDVRCQTCGSENKSGRKFCSGCGGVLPLACANCGYANEPDDRFCGGCGAALGRKEAADSEGELRPVTIVFADLSGYTALANTLEPDETRDLLNAFFAAADGAVAAAGGKIDKHIGDCVMAIFGAPIAHGDDTARAARAAIDIRERTRALAEARGVALDSHTGMATGLVAAGDTGSSVHKSYTVIGQAVNLAARLCEHAASGEILATADIARALAGAFGFDGERSIQVDGFTSAIKVANLTGRGAASRAQSPEVVGRDRELRLIEAALAAAKDTGRGQVIVLRGEPGLGKTRLVEETAARAGAFDYAVRVAQVTNFGTGPDADAMRAALRALADIEGARDSVAALEQCLASSGLAAHLQALAHELAGHAIPAQARLLLSALGPEAREHGRAEAIAGFALHAARDRPLLFVVEDMHWASREMAQAMAETGRNLADVPAILLMTARSEADPFDASWRAALGTTPLTMIDLAPLDQADANRLVRNLAQGSAEIERIVERAGGSPLFLVQLAHYVFEAETDLPASIRSVVAARFDQLSPEGRPLLQCAAVLGLRFGRAELAFMREDERLKLDELFERHMLRPAGGIVEFIHALVRDAVYDMLPKSRRKRLHGRAAEWFAGRVAALWAHHLGLAGDARAARAYWQAAEEARAAFRHAEARDLNGRGLAFAASDADRLDLLVQRGEILLDLGEGREAESVWRDAAGLAGDDPALVRAEIGVAQALRLLGRGGEAEAALRRAETAAQEDRDGELMSLLHFIRGNLLFPTGRYDDCVREHRRALSHAQRAGSAEAEVRALGGLGDADYLRGRIVSAEVSFRGCVELADRHGFGQIALANRPMHAICRLLCGDLADAMERASAVIRQAAEIGSKRAEMIAQHCLCVGHQERDEFQAGLAAADRAGELASQLGARHFESEAALFRAVMLHGLADRQAALGEARRAVALARQSSMTFMGPVCLAGVAQMTVDEAERGAAIAELTALLDAGSIAHNYYFSYRFLIDSAIARRDWSEALGWTDALERFATPEPFFYATLFSSAARALAGHGRHEIGATERAREIAADAQGRGFASAARWIGGFLT
jgi:class 3 adenylate cyclase/tetratricopeptide (TPR) repeat protein